MFEELINALRPTKTVVLCKIEEPVLRDLRMLAKGLLLNQLNTKAAIAEHIFHQAREMGHEELVQGNETLMDQFKKSYEATERSQQLQKEDDQLRDERRKVIMDYLVRKNISSDRDIAFDLQTGEVKEEVPK